MKKIWLKIVLVLSLSLVLVAPAAAAPGQPNFGPAIYADGQVFGTKSVTVLPAPNGHNLQSFDKLFAFTNGAEGQLAVAEAAPGNPAYNAGRWYVHTATWTAAGIAAYNGNLPVLTSYAQVMQQNAWGYLDIMVGPPAGGPPPFFLCPLLPVH